jgi:hypothetical protein
MVEVWVPYDETEYPILLPDPIDLRLASRVIIPDEEEEKIIEELKEKLSEFTSPKIYIDNYLDDSERRVLRDYIKKDDISIIDNPIEADIVIGITRQDPIFGYTGSSSAYYYHEIYRDPNWLSKSLNGLSPESEILEEIKSSYPDDKFGISFIMDGQGRAYKVFMGYGSSHWMDSINEYRSYWEIKVDLSPIVIASLGGYPYDTGVKGFLKGLLKLIPKVDEKAMVFIIGDGSRVMEYDLTRLSGLKPGDLNDIDDLLFLKAKNLVAAFEGRIILQTSLSATVCRLIGIKSINNVEKVLSRIPARRKRIITVIEDLINIYLP